MTDFLGPANAPLAVTQRPADGRAYGSLDTWFKDCSSDAADDGTSLKADFLNGLLGEVRAFVRSNGLRADGITPLIVEDGSTETLLRRAAQYMIQRGKTVAAFDAGNVVNALAVSLSPALIEYSDWLRIVVSPALTNTGAATIDVNGRGAKQIVRRDGSQLLPGDIVAGAPIELVYLFGRFVAPSLIVRPTLPANLNLFVNAAIGNDANDGTANVAGKAVATIQRAIAIAFNYAPSQYTVHIYVADGTYPGFATPSYSGPTIFVHGNNAAPQNVVVAGGSGHACAVTGPNTMDVQGIHVTTGTPVDGVCGFVAGAGAILRTDFTSSGFVQGGVFEAFGGTLVPGTHRFTGNSQSLFWAYNGGGLIQFLRNKQFTITAPISVTQTALAIFGGVILVDTPAPVFVNPSYVTGARYNASYNGVINSSGTGESYFPGTVAGVKSAGGQYA